MGWKTSEARAAMHAMRDLGFAEELTCQVLKNLLNLYGDDWDPIKNKNYIFLANAILNAQEDASNRVRETVGNDATNEGESMNSVIEAIGNDVTNEEGMYRIIEKVRNDTTNEEAMNTIIETEETMNRVIETVGDDVTNEAESTRAELSSLLSTPEKLLDMKNSNSAKEKLLNLESCNVANLNILIPSPNSSTGSFIIGPILKSTKDANMTNSILTKTTLLFNQPSINVSSWHVPESRPLRSWPVSNKLYIEWLDRIEYRMADIWREIGIYDIIQMSRDFSLKPHPYLIGASLCFWSTASNSLHLQYGMATPTLFDLAAIAGLRPDGCSVNAAMDVDISLFNDDIKDSRDYTAFVKKFNAKDGPVQFKEHVAFLWYWICRFIACSPARVIVHQYLGLAVCLAQGRKLALGQFVLGELYRAISDVILHLNSEDKRFEFANAGRPLWIYQIWLYAYFPELVYLDDFLLPPSPPNYGARLLYCLPKWGKLNKEDFVENFSFFYNLKDRPDEYYAPFAKRIFGPSWFKFGILDWSNHVTVWCKFLCSSGLHVGLTFSGRYKHTHSGVEYYFPNCVARQFGLNQGVPFLLLYWFCHEYRVPFKCLDDIKRVEEVNAMLHEQYSHKALTPSSCTTNEFDLWWMDYVKSTFQSQISDLKDRLLFTSQKQLPMKSIRLCDVLVSKTSNKRKKLPLAKIVKRAHSKSFTRPEKRQPAKKKARQSSPTPSVCKKMALRKGDTSNDLVLLTRKDFITHSTSNQRETDRNYTCLDPNENPSSSLHNIAGGSPDIDSILRSIEVEPDEEGLLAFVNSLSQTTNERASVESVATSSKIKASLEELDLILSKEFITVCQETALFERLKELVKFLISQVGHDFIGRGMITALQDINQQIDHMQLKCIYACKSITEITEKQKEENMNERDLLRIKKLLEKMEVKLHAAEERRNELTARKLEYENKLREVEEDLEEAVKESSYLSCIKRKAQERAIKLTPKFSEDRKEMLSLEKEKAAARQMCNDLNLKWSDMGASLQKCK